MTLVSLIAYLVESLMNILYFIFIILEVFFAISEE